MTSLARFWNSLEVVLGGLLAAAATGIVLYATFMRYVFQVSPAWTLEITIYLMIWAAFILASTLVRENGHVGADFLVIRLNARAQWAIAVAVVVAALLFEIVVLYYGILFVVDAFTFGTRSPSALRFPMWIVYSAVPAGALLIGCRLVFRLLAMASSRRVQPVTSVLE